MFPAEVKEPEANQGGLEKGSPFSLRNQWFESIKIGRRFRSSGIRKVTISVGVLSNPFSIRGAEHLCIGVMTLLLNQFSWRPLYDFTSRIKNAGYRVQAHLGLVILNDPDVRSIN